MRSTCSGSSSFGSKAVGSWMSARPSPRRGFSARRCPSGAAPLWQTSKTSRSHVTRCCTSRRLVGRRSKLGSRPISPSAATPDSSESCACSSSSIRFASDSAASSCSPSIGQADRQTRSMSTQRRGERSSPSSDSSPARRYSGCSKPFWNRSRCSIWALPPRRFLWSRRRRESSSPSYAISNGVDALGSVGRVLTSGAGGELIFVHIAAPATLGAATAALSTARDRLADGRDRPGSLPSRRRPGRGCRPPRPARGCRHDHCRRRRRPARRAKSWQSSPARRVTSSSRFVPEAR